MNVQEIRPWASSNDAGASTQNNICKTFWISLFLLRIAIIIGVHENTYLKREKVFHGVQVIWYEVVNSPTFCEEWVEYANYGNSRYFDVDWVDLRNRTWTWNTA